jgi:surfeit locus 1 family protein
MKKILSKFLVLLGIFILVSLGVWQLFRMTCKEALISDLEHKSDMTIVAPSEIVEEYLYRTIEVCGHYMKGEDLFVYNKPNYIVLGSFHLENLNKNIIVARGEVSADNKHQTSFLLHNEERICIAGMLLPSEKEPLFMPAYDGSPQKPLLTINTQSVSNLLSTPLYDMYILLTDKNTDPLLMPIKKPEAQKIYNNHLEYALTWFILAGILIFMFVTSRRNVDSKIPGKK